MLVSFTVLSRRRFQNLFPILGTFPVNHSVFSFEDSEFNRQFPLAFVENGTAARTEVIRVNHNCDPKRNKQHTSSHCPLWGLGPVTAAKTKVLRKTWGHGTWLETIISFYMGGGDLSAQDWQLIPAVWVTQGRSRVLRVQTAHATTKAKQL